MASENEHLRGESSVISSELLSIIAIIFCILAFYLYLQRLELPHIPDDDSWQHQEPVPETPMFTTTLPFQMKLDDKTRDVASLREGVLITVETSVPCSLMGFWIVECAGLTKILQSCERSRQNGLHLPNFEAQLQEISLSHSSKYWLEQDNTRQIHLRVTEESDASKKSSTTLESEPDLGPLPRTRYPLVVLVTQGWDAGDDENAQTDAAVKTILWILHLPDKTVTKSSHVISRVIVTAEGQVCELQRLFLESEDCTVQQHNSKQSGASPEDQVEQSGASPEDQTEQSGASPEDQTELSSAESRLTDNSSRVIDRSCTVCQNAPISRTIIPCRHACVCQHCIGLLSACPMCRGTIASYFRIRTQGSARGDDVVEDHQPNDRLEQGMDVTARIQHILERFNDWFGF
ncbi:cell growth regulator with RING finger domain protein 1-like [Diadema antillarum]|uniref:cell growth regulator with RING finger domain protein 1-like n=1 Tax=Diadema antillarum TaxID=105358 RepID=UPI003A8AAA4F